MNSKHNEKLQNKVAELRKKEQQTQQGLADSVEVTRQTVIAIEKGNYVPSVLLAMKLAKHFNTTVERIFYV